MLLSPSENLEKSAMIKTFTIILLIFKEDFFLKFQKMLRNVYRYSSRDHFRF